MENVNSTKLTNDGVRLGKMEKQVLHLLTLPARYSIPNYDTTGYPPDGSCVSLLAKEIYGHDAFDCGGAMKDLPKVALSRILHRLYRKGLVRIYWHPRQSRVWEKIDDVPGIYGFYGSDQKSISVWVREWGRLEYDTELQNPNTYATELPSHVKRWWALTDKGREVAQQLALSVAQKGDEWQR